MKIIAFGHRKRTGKDTCVMFAMSYVRQHYPKIRCDILSFGNVIKDIAHRLYYWGGLEVASYYENHPSEIEEVLPTVGKSPRQIWDAIGLYGREICEKTWIELAIQRTSDVDILFCKDLRSIQETELVDRFGGLKIRIDRDSASRGGPVDELLANYTKWDMILDNNGTLKELNQKVKDICNQAIARFQYEQHLIK